MDRGDRPVGGETLSKLRTRWTRRSRTRKPRFGRLGLDSARIIHGPAVVVPSPAGVASRLFTVPNSPSLAGVQLHVQALAVKGAALHMTNTMLDPIR